MKSHFFQLRPIQVIKVIVYALYAILLISVSSSFLPAINYRWAIPDLLLCATVATAYYENEKAAAVFGMLSGFALESVGSVGFSLLPLFYMVCGCVCALLFVSVLQKNFGAYMLYTAAFMLVRSAISLIYIQFAHSDYSIDIAFSNVILPEYAATLISAPILFALGYLVSRGFKGAGEDNAVKM